MSNFRLLVLKESEEKDLLKSIRKGDLHSFEIIFQTYYLPLCHFAFQFLNDNEVSKDVVSELFVTLWNRRKQLIIRQSIKSYLYRSTRNAVISYLRKNRIEYAHFDDDTSQGDLSISPETILIKEELKNELDQLIQGLPTKSGLVFRMKKVDGLSYKEIAEVLGITEKTVENHITIAVKKIREALRVKPELEAYFKS